MSSNFDILRSPVISEKSYSKQVDGVYVFLVKETATKLDVRGVVESLYKVKVEDVNILNLQASFKRTMKGTKKRISGYKKAYVKLKAGNSIDFEKVV